MFFSTDEYTMLFDPFYTFFNSTVHFWVDRTSGIVTT